MKGPFRNKQGSTLLEIVVAIAVLGLMVAPVCSSLVLSHRLNAESEKTLQARLLLERTVEQLMGEGIEYTTDAEGKLVLKNELEPGITVTTDFTPEKTIVEEVIDEYGNPVFDEKGDKVTVTHNIELWYNVIVTCDDIEIKTVIKAAPEYVDEAGEGGGA